VIGTIRWRWEVSAAIAGGTAACCGGAGEAAAVPGSAALPRSAAEAPRNSRREGWLAMVVVGLAVAVHMDEASEHSHKHLVAAYEAQRPSPASRLIYVAQRPLSADFYSHGALVKVADVAALRPYLDDTTPDFIALRDVDAAALPEADRARLQPVTRSGSFRLLREVPR
jgi:hypothetical protein